MRQPLINPDYMRFPFEFDDQGVATSKRKAHINEQIEQLLLTEPRERVMRPYFGVGLRGLVFEPNSEALQATIRERLTVVLNEALEGEIDPSSLDIRFGEGESHELLVNISYSLLALDQRDSHRISLGRDYG